MNDPRRLRCLRCPGRPPLDGRLEGMWGDALWSEPFVDIEGDKQPVPTLETRCKLLWDDEFLYVGAWLEEPQLFATLTEHNSVIFHDPDFEVFLDPDGDGLRYVEIEVNALGTSWELMLPKKYRDGGSPAEGWELPGFQVSTWCDGGLNDPISESGGWSLTMAIPFAPLVELNDCPIPPRVGDVWRINFSRVQWDLEIVDGRFRKIEGRPEHNWVWSPQGEIDMHLPDRWGALEFV